MKTFATFEPFVVPAAPRYCADERCGKKLAQANRDTLCFSCRAKKNAARVRSLTGNASPAMLQREAVYCAVKDCSKTTRALNGRCREHKQIKIGTPLRAATEQRRSA
jgi:hypothetical protein